MRPRTYLFPGTHHGWRADAPITSKVIWEAVRLAARKALTLSASASGSTVTLTWSAPPSSPLTGYIIEAGSAPGLANLANFSTGNTLTTFSATGIGAGTYYVRVNGNNLGGRIELRQVRGAVTRRS